MEIVIFTIGFAGKNAREFFTKLKEAGVKTVIDIRLNNVSQLAGFTKEQDLPYFLQEIAGIKYAHKPELAPTKDIITPQFADKSCFLCSEPKAEKCHRRLVAEYLRELWGNVKIVHL